ncbi:MAG: dihydropteroate synthase, partial [Akkermansia sp.]|nr:dihydropteroate synthase [Akkermansia sp.]
MKFLLYYLCINMNETIIYIALLAAGASFVQRTIGFGFGIFIMTALPFLMPSYGEAVTLSGLLSLTSATVVMIKYVKFVNWRRLLPIVAAFVVFSSAAIILLDKIEGRAMRMTLGVMLLIISLYFSFFKAKLQKIIRPTAGWQLGVGTASGVMGGLFGMHGPPVVLYLVASEPDIARVPCMIDSSKWEVIEAGLRCVQGKGIVNSISLKNGEEEFLRQARIIRRYGAAVVVMGFDEHGQACGYDDRVAIAHRAYELLTEKVGFPAEDIIFDPNVLTVGTGIAEHANHALHFFQASAEITRCHPLCHISGGISNVSFSFRGNNPVREAMHSAFLHHAALGGLDLCIVNAALMTDYDTMPAHRRKLVEDVLLNSCEDATECLIAYAQELAEAKAALKAAGAGTPAPAAKQQADWRTLSVQERLAHALVNGITEHIEADTREALELCDTPLQVIEGPLMDGMKQVG